MNSETFIVFHIKKRIAIIGGTEYGGEMKKGIFSILHYLLPKKDILSMHCSANVDEKNNNPAIFFGLSGTGKTTLSTDHYVLLLVMMNTDGQMRAFLTLKAVAMLRLLI